MGFKLSAAGLGWLAAALAGFSLGSAAAWTLKALSARKRQLGRKSRSAVSLVLLSLTAFVAAAAAVLILPPKGLFVQASFWIWAAAFAPAGFLSVLFPRAVGMPLAVLGLAALGLLAAEAAVWHRLVPEREAARFIPYERTDSGFRGDLSVPDRNAVPVLSRISLDAGECALEARVLELSGPLAPLFGPRRYVLAACTDGLGGELLRFPRGKGPLGFLLKGPQAHLGWLELRTVRSAVLPLSEYQSIYWSFTPDGELAASTLQ